MCCELYTLVLLLSPFTLTVPILLHDSVDTLQFRCELLPDRRRRRNIKVINRRSSIRSISEIGIALQLQKLVVETRRYANAFGT